MIDEVASAENKETIPKPLPGTLVLFDVWGKEAFGYVYEPEGFGTRRGMPVDYGDEICITYLERSPNGNIGMRTTSRFVSEVKIPPQDESGLGPAFRHFRLIAKDGRIQAVALMCTKAGLRPDPENRHFICNNPRP